jgi:gas vesicle protein
MSEHQTTDSLAAFMLGAIVGAGVALLLAPQTGEETRKLIGDRGRQLADDATSKLQGVKEDLKSHSGDLKKAVVAGKDAFNQARHGNEPAPTSTVI